MGFLNHKEELEGGCALGVQGGCSIILSYIHSRVM